MGDADHQLPLAIGGESVAPNLVKTTRKANRARGARLAREQPSLIADRKFLPIAGVPKNRSECPTERPCNRVTCEWHLWRIAPEERAGRPGLGKVPRDAAGKTLQVVGNMGDEREATLRPAWLSVRGMELEREVKVYVSKDEQGGIELLEVRNGTLDYWLAHLDADDVVLVFDDGTSELVAKGKLRGQAFVFDRELPAYVFGSSSSLVLTRAREVDSCGLDVIERAAASGEKTTSAAKVGQAIGRDASMVRKIVRGALLKLERAGVSGEDMAALTEGNDE